MEVFAVGGYDEIGRNMTAVRVGNECVILDCGFHVDKIMMLEDDERMEITPDELIDIDALPNDRKFYIEHGREVKAMILSHAHLDHIGGVPYIAAKYKCPVIGTPFTLEVLKNLMKDKKIKLPNQITVLNHGSKMRVGKNFEIEFIYVTHSTLQTAIIALHTPEGILVYSNDFKFDQHPPIGRKTNYARLKALGSSNQVKALITDTTRVDSLSKTYSESIVKAMLEDILTWVNDKKTLIVLTSFSSHIARIKIFLQFADLLKRKPILMGRSLANYVKAAEDLGFVNFSKTAKICNYRHELEKAFKEINTDPGKHILICTGNQGEPNAVLSRLARDKYKHYHFREDDIVIFSSEVIPTPTIIANREALERKLLDKKVRVYKDVHQSGHAGREDLREMINMVKPRNYIPTHGGLQKIASAIELAQEEHYELGKTAFILRNGQKVNLQ